MSIPTGDTLFPSITESTLFWSSKLIHPVDCRKVEEEGIIQNRQLHPGTLLSTTSLRETPIVGKCVRVCVINANKQCLYMLDISKYVWNRNNN